MPFAAMGMMLVLQGGMHGKVLLFQAEAPGARARSAAAMKPVRDRATRSWAA